MTGRGRAEWLVESAGLVARLAVEVDLWAVGAGTKLVEDAGLLTSLAGGGGEVVVGPAGAAGAPLATLKAAALALSF